MREIFERRCLVVYTAVLLCIVGCKNEPTVLTIPTAQMINGRTMGTTYVVKYMPPVNSPSAEAVGKQIDDELQSVNSQMSTYIASSEISKFNVSRSTDWFDVSKQTAEVVQQAIRIAAATDGAFDVTVGPLVDLWGFGPSRARRQIPDEDQISEALLRCGIDKLEVRLSPPAVKKSIPDLRVDLSGIAKGHGVDRVADRLQSLGITSYFIEIGGEIRAAGAKSPGSPWRAGIEKPSEGNRELLTAVDVIDCALATSGNYRNFYEEDGKKFWHTINPESGLPTQEPVLQASVISDSCSEADAIATALMVLGQDGIALAEKNNWPVMIVVPSASSDAPPETLATESFLQLMPPQK